MLDHAPSINENHENGYSLKTIKNSKILPAPFQQEEKIQVDELYINEIKWRKILVAKRGSEHILIQHKKIVLFSLEKRIVLAYLDDGSKYIAGENLTMLTKTLDNKDFFKANRQYIININYIQSFRTYEKVKLKIELNNAELNNRHTIIVSQETSQKFRKWIRLA